MTDLRNTIAHILEHKQHLAEANGATTQQYVVLPILPALGWDDANFQILPKVHGVPFCFHKSYAETLPPVIVVSVLEGC